jgi:hypothetical protein
MRRKRKRRGSDRTHGGSDRTHGGSDRTRGGTDRTRAEEESLAPVTDANDSDEGWDPAAEHMEPSEGWWNRYGFESFGAYLRHSETGPNRPFSFDSLRKRKKKVPAADLPAGAAPGRRNSVPTRQISIRLDEDGYQDLVKAARMYGVAPATMGRLLVAKGARLAVESG